MLHNIILNSYDGDHFHLKMIRSVKDNETNRNGELDGKLLLLKDGNFKFRRLRAADEMWLFDDGSYVELWGQDEDDQ